MSFNSSLSAHGEEGNLQNGFPEWPRSYIHRLSTPNSAHFVYIELFGGGK
jgi:hypothetical protein